MTVSPSPNHSPPAGAYQHRCPSPASGNPFSRPRLLRGPWPGARLSRHRGRRGPARRGLVGKSVSRRDAVSGRRSRIPATEATRRTGSPAADRCRLVAAAHRRPGRAPDGARARSDKEWLLVSRPVHHAGVHLQPDRGPAHRHHALERPLFRDVLADAQPLPAARYAHLLSQDGYDEVIDLAMIQSDPRIVLAYAWNGQPLPPEHGFPLRVYVPDVYGMKQPKWITEVVLAPDFIPGYWVRRGWDSRAQRRTTSVIDTVATSD